MSRSVALVFALVCVGCTTADVAATSSTTTDVEVSTETTAPPNSSTEPAQTPTSVTTSTSIPATTTTLSFSQLRRTPPTSQPLLLVHPECSDAPVVWFGDELWEGREQLLPLHWKDETSISGTFERTDRLAEFGIETGIFTSFDGFEFEVTTGATQDACMFWEIPGTDPSG